MALLGKEQILAADDLQVREIDIPEWGGTVRVRGMTGTERDRFEFQTALARKNGGVGADIRGSYVGRCIIDENGDRVFTDGELAALGRKSGDVLDRLFDVVRGLSGMTDDKLREAVKNFETAPNGNSPSV